MDDRPRRIARLALRVLAPLLLAAFSAGSCVLPSRSHLRCEGIDEPFRTLDPRRPADWRHLRNDVERAEEIGVRYGDAYRAREGRAAEHRRQQSCTEALLHRLSVVHTVPFDELTALRGRRPVLLDSTVLLIASALYLFLARRLAGILSDRLSEQKTVVVLVVGLGVALPVSAVGVIGLRALSTVVEMARLWSTHISYRGDRLPWPTYTVLLLAGGIAAFEGSAWWCHRSTRRGDIESQSFPD